MSSAPPYPESNGPPPPPWGLVADDLTGACDAAASFAQRGFPAKVLLGREPLEIARDGLTAVSTESRGVTPEVAAGRVTAACDWFSGQGVRILYKKVDSVLRGNVMEEIAAVLNSTGMQDALLTPAFPKMGRIVIGGKLIVPALPGLPPINLHEKFAALPSLRIADARDDGDLAAIVAAVFESEPLPLLAGSAGLATALASYLAARFGPQANGPRLPRCDSAVYFIGTPHTVTAAQLDYLIRRRETAVWQLEGLGMDTAALANDRLIIRVGWDNPCSEQCDRLWDWLEAHPRAGIVLSGGDTAAFFCEAAAARAIELGGEAFPGIPWGMLRGGRADGHFVVTKSGGFGAESALIEVDDFLRGSSPRS